MVPDTSGVTLNGYSMDYFSAFLTGPVHVAQAQLKTSYLDAVAYDGSIDLSLVRPQNIRTKLDTATYFNRRKVTVPICILGTIQEVQDGKVLLGQLAGREVKLYDPYEDGYWVGRLTLPAWSDIYEAGSGLKASDGKLEINADPFLHKETITEQFDSRRVNNFIHVFSSVPVFPVITIEADQSEHSSEYTKNNGISGSVSLNIGFVDEDSVTTNYCEFRLDALVLANKVTLDPANGIYMCENVWDTPTVQRVSPTLTSDIPYLQPGRVSVNVNPRKGKKGKFHKIELSYTPKIMI